MEWIELNSEEKLTEAMAASEEKPVLLFKHSTTCSISNTVLNRLERNWNNLEVPDAKAYFLDLLSYRGLSNDIANLFQVEHQSPQVLIIQNQKSVYNSSHFDINYSSVKSELNKISIKS